MAAAAPMKAQWRIVTPQKTAEFAPVEEISQGGASLPTLCGLGLKRMTSTRTEKPICIDLRGVLAQLSACTPRPKATVDLPYKHPRKHFKQKPVAAMNAHQAALRPQFAHAFTNSATVNTTRSIISAVISGYNGSERMRDWWCKATGKSFERCPRCR